MIGNKYISYNKKEIRATWDFQVRNKKTASWAVQNREDNKKDWKNEHNKAF